MSILAIISCTPIEQNNISVTNESPETAAQSQANTPQLLPESDAQVVRIRIKNRSNVDFDQITVRFPDETITYAPVIQGEASDYQTVTRAYRYAAIELTGNGAYFVFQPIDYVGEIPLLPGLYTYALTTSQGRLILELEED